VEELYDCAIIGGGPAGLSAAVYMGRFLRKTVVIDDAQGRSTYAQVNDNYLGFPDGLPIKQLRALGEQQAAKFGVEFFRSCVRHLKREGENFVAECGERSIRAKTVILCTGVRDIWPDIPDVERYVGRSLFWCIVCDGFRTAGKRIVLLGRDDDAAVTATQFLAYTEKITFVAPPGELDCSEAKLKALEEHGIDLLEGAPDHLEGAPDHVRALVLRDGRRLECDLIFSLFGSDPDVGLATEVGAELTSKGYVRIDIDGYTTVPGFFCAGDVSGIHTQQVASAVHEGAEAAMTANYYLYANYQRLEYGTPEEHVRRVLSHRRA
jgi:thioredoxin reductase (NADPH)